MFYKVDPMIRDPVLLKGTSLESPQEICFLEPPGTGYVNCHAGMTSQKTIRIMALGI